MNWDVVAVKLLSDRSFQVQFADGTVGEVVLRPSHLTGVFAPLNDPVIFRQVHIDGGAVAWPGNVDLAPDAMYRAIKANGAWILD